MAKTTLTSKQRYRQMASATRRAANRYYKRGMSYCSDDSELVEMFKTDLRDLRQFARFVNQGQIIRAAKAMDRMDTAVYEVIPDRTYSYVNRGGLRYCKSIIRCVSSSNTNKK